MENEHMETESGELRRGAVRAGHGAAIPKNGGKLRRPEMGAVLPSEHAQISSMQCRRKSAGAGRRTVDERWTTDDSATGIGLRQRKISVGAEICLVSSPGLTGASGCTGVGAAEALQQACAESAQQLAHTTGAAGAQAASTGLTGAIAMPRSTASRSRRRARMERIQLPPEIASVNLGLPSPQATVRDRQSAATDARRKSPRCAPSPAR